MAHKAPNLTVTEKKKNMDNRCRKIEDKKLDKITKYQDLKSKVERLRHKSAIVAPVAHLVSYPKILDST